MVDLVPLAEALPVDEPSVSKAIALLVQKYGAEFTSNPLFLEQLTQNTPIAASKNDVAPVPAAAPSTSTQQLIDPYNVSGEIGADGVAKAIDYTKLVDQFGTQLIDKALLERFEKVTGHKAHRFMRRGIVFSHRDLTVMLDRHERGEPFFLYTGRGPSSDSMHIGHTVPFAFTKWLQDVFDVPLVIMLTDDEKFLFGPRERTVEEVQSFARSNAKDIIAVGFDPKKTFIFSDFDYMGGAFYANVVRIQKRYNFNAARATFGFDGESNVGKIAFGAVQGATAFATTFPHIFGTDDKVKQIPALIPCAIDQDPYFRLTRDVAQPLGLAKPGLIHARFLDALQGPGSKMSASVDASAIFMKDTAKKIKDKINKNAFSGGQVSEAEHRELGGNPDIDVSYQYLTFFLEDDEELAKVYRDYRTGHVLTGELKAMCIKELQAYVEEFQQRRAAVTEETVDHFMARKPLVWGGNPNAIKPAAEESITGKENTEPGKLTQNQQKKLDKERRNEEKKAKVAAEKAAAKAAKDAQT